MRRIAFAALLMFLAPGLVRAELRPDEVGILAMSASEPSRKLAEHYAKVRGVRHTLLLEGKPAVAVAREEWETSYQPAIRNWLGEKGRERIRCLVTCWDVPLRIERRSDRAPAVVARQRELRRMRAVLAEQGVKLLKELDEIAAAGKPAERQRIESAAELAKQLEAALQAAQERVKAMPAEKEKEKEEKQQAVGAIERVFVQARGINALVLAVETSAEAAKLKPDVRQRIEFLKGQDQGLTAGLQALSNLPDTAARDAQIRDLLLKARGLLGTMQWIDQEQELLKKNETAASFDSELAPILWPDYPLFLWQPNLLHYRFDPVRASAPKTLMVARLEAPTVELATKLVDVAAAIEKSGLKGKVYVDARGIPAAKPGERPGSYGEYDQSLRDLAERLKQHTKLEVVLDNEAKLFQKGECPEAALYCGWYSLAKYVDAFTWQPGAVAYHVASAEAETIRTPGSPVWCNAMLERGACATLGPVFEPYLASFPLPDDFFSLLLTGKYTLAEAYYRTLPVNSWAMVLVGDPLYNPFKKHPALSEEQLPERMRPKGAETTR